MRTYKQELQHLYKSDFIRSFAEIDTNTGEYKRDIKDADKKIFYLCDGKACGENHSCGECLHTSDITHALNFKYDGHNGYWEQPTPTINPVELKALIDKLVEVLPDLVNACIEYLPEYIEGNKPVTDPETVTDKCPHETDCTYYPYGCGKCTYND